LANNDPSLNGIDSNDINGPPTGTPRLPLPPAEVFDRDTPAPDVVERDKPPTGAGLPLLLITPDLALDVDLLAVVAERDTPTDPDDAGEEADGEDTLRSGAEGVDMWC